MDPNTAVVPASDPAISGGDPNANTLDNLEANVRNIIVEQQPPTPPTDASPGDAPAAATQVPGEPASSEQEPAEPAAPAAQVEPTAAEAEAKAHRIQQENANLRTTLIKMGVNPDSDIAEQLRSGMITRDDLMRISQPAPPAQPQVAEPAAPEVPLEQKLRNIQAMRTAMQKKPEISQEDFKAFADQQMDVMIQVAQDNQAIKQEQENTALQNLLNQTEGAAKNVFGTAVKAAIPENVREIAEHFFVGATDLDVGELARNPNIGRQKAFTPQGYTHAATQLAPKFDQFVNAVFKAGNDAAIAAIQKANPGANVQGAVNPLPPGTGGGSPPPPAQKGTFAIENLDRNVDAFLATTQAQV
ncbi:MAG: hypothetical protein ACYSTJ_04985 [Planctomycetota bacterium]|jgi:hypothetical protein